MKKNYLVQPDLYQERGADYETQKYLNGVFQTISSKSYPEEGTNGNIQNEIFVSRRTKKVKLMKRPNMISEPFSYKKFEGSYCHFYEAISSALALYRLICMFPKPKFTCMEGANGYKVTWEILFRHKLTKEVIGIGEWKGGISLRGTKNIEDYDKRTIEDFTKLLNLMLSENSPHPYDRVTAGSVA